MRPTAVLEVSCCDAAKVVDGATSVLVSCSEGWVLMGLRGEVRAAGKHPYGKAQPVGYCCGIYYLMTDNNYLMAINEEGAELGRFKSLEGEWWDVSITASRGCVLVCGYDSSQMSGECACMNPVGPARWSFEVSVSLARGGGIVELLGQAVVGEVAYLFFVPHLLSEAYKPSFSSLSFNLRQRRTVSFEAHQVVYTFKGKLDEYKKTVSPRASGRANVFAFNALSGVPLGTQELDTVSPERVEACSSALGVLDGPDVRVYRPEGWRLREASQLRLPGFVEAFVLEPKCEAVAFTDKESLGIYNVRSDEFESYEVKVIDLSWNVSLTALVYEDGFKVIKF